MKRISLICLLFFCLNSNAFALDLSAESACLMIADTKEVIFQKNADEKKSMASTTKIMTALLAIESDKMDEVAVISKNAERQEGSSIYLRAGEKISVNELVYGLMLNSGNDAAVAIAEHISGSVPAFAEQMTKRAGELGAKSTSFKNPNGLDEDGHFTTAKDLALIAAYAMENNNFYEIVSTKSHAGVSESGENLYFTNHNKLLNMYDGAVGIKTGFTKASGRCLVSAAEREGVLLIAVTLNAPDDWNDHKKMLDYGFEKAELTTILREGDILKTEKINDKNYNFVASQNIKIANLGKKQFEVRLNMPDKILAPLNKGEKVGVGKILLDGNILREFDILSEENIEKIIPKKSFCEIFLNVFSKII